ncbi:hypothetical protein LDENG_00114590, partial [Lucifuga dentata]
QAASVSEAAVSFLLSPLSLYSWLASTLVRLLLSSPALVLSCLHHALLLLLAWPWCVITICVSLLLNCLHVALYLIHLVLVVGVVAILTLTRHKMAGGDSNNEKVRKKQKKLMKVRMFGSRVTQQG